MKEDVVAALSDVGLTYRKSKHKVASLKQTAINILNNKIEYENFSALKNISLEIHQGETIGVIGRNGAGKSSLLKILSKVLPPSVGRVVVKGRIAPMIELGAGFNLELTGSENILLYGALLGRPINEISQRIENIASWAELESELEVPLRSYSSGMLARLAFSVATDTSPDLLLIDEVLSVGDEKFKEKSFKRSKELINGGCAVVLVSHDLDLISELSNKVVYLEGGCLKAFGEPGHVIKKYLSDVRD